MIMFEWRDKYSVGIDQIDNQHKKLIDLMNDLHDNIKLRKDKTALESVLNELFYYTQTHFNEEIDLMAEHGYPDIQSHKNEHDKFITELNTIREKLENQGNLLNVQLLYILKDWLINHIMVTDMKYSDYIKNTKKI